MALRFALLAALHEQPGTGYELTRHFRHRQAHVWNASHQQIYRELAKLHGDGLLAMQTIPQSDKPDRKRYALTVAGEAALRDWLATPQPRPPTRDPLLVKLFAGDCLDDTAMAKELAGLRRHYQRQLATFEEIRATWFLHPESLPRHYRLQYLALRRGIRSATDWLGWLEELEDAFDSGGA